VKGKDTSWRHLLESVTHREREQRTLAQGDLNNGEGGLSPRDHLNPKEKETTIDISSSKGRFG
jgi:hypothetical protein